MGRADIVWRMKFLLSVIVYLAFAALFGWGICGVAHGKFAVLIATTLVYLVIAARTGCHETH
jgi:hypothetical protein